MKATQTEGFIDAVLDGIEKIEDARLQELLRVGERIVEVRRNHQGGGWWETIDAAWRLRDLRLWASLNGKQRARLREAETLETQVLKLYDVRRYEEAEPLLRQTLAIREEQPSLAKTTPTTRRA